MGVAGELALPLFYWAAVQMSKRCPLPIPCPSLPMAGSKLGPDTGSLQSFQSIGEVLESFEKQMQFWTDQMCGGLNVIDRIQREKKPLPYASAFFGGCMEKGRDLG